MSEGRGSVRRMTTTYFTASSVDGFIADRQGSLSWLLSRDSDPAGPVGYDAFLGGVGALAMGATTYDWVRRHEQDWPYWLPCWVFSHRALALPPGADVRVTAAGVTEVHAEMLVNAGGKDVWLVGGGDLVGQFADRGLLDEVWVQYAPMALGAGTPILPRRLELRLLAFARNRDFLCGRYSVQR